MPSTGDVVLRDGELLLRAWRDEDRAAIGVSLDDPELGRYLGVPFGGFPARDPEAPWFAIVEDGVPVGRIWFAAGKRPFEVGYFLRRDAWGRGLATRSLRLVCAWLFAQGEQTIELCTHPGNERSQRVPERVGFRPAGEIERYARFEDGTARALRFTLP